MLDHIIEQAREEKIFSREDTPTEQRVLAGFVYHAGTLIQPVHSAVSVTLTAGVPSRGEADRGAVDRQVDEKVCDEQPRGQDDHGDDWRGSRRRTAYTSSSGSCCSAIARACVA